MPREIVKKEVEIARKAFGSIAFVLWSAFPMHVLGWLVSTIGQYPLLEAEIRHESLYKLFLMLKGGVNTLGQTFLLILWFVFLISLSYLLRITGHSESVDGMAQGRIVIRKFLIPSFLSASAFAAGAISGGSLNGIVLLLSFAMIAAAVLYVTDTTATE